MADASYTNTHKKKVYHSSKNLTAVSQLTHSIGFRLSLCLHLFDHLLLSLVVLLHLLKLLLVHLLEVIWRERRLGIRF